MNTESVIPSRDHGMREGAGRFVNRPTKTGGKTYDKFLIYVPVDVARDTGFQLKEGGTVKITVEGQRVIIEKAEQNNE